MISLRWIYHYFYSLAWHVYLKLSEAYPNLISTASSVKRIGSKLDTLKDTYYPMIFFFPKLPSAHKIILYEARLSPQPLGSL